jgi:hypothetical protein
LRRQLGLELGVAIGIQVDGLGVGVVNEWMG